MIASLRKDLKLETPRPRPAAAVGELSVRDACERFVSRFYARMEETRPRSYRADSNVGGRRDWEEATLGDFARAESRLVDITETLCHLKDRTCHMYLEQHADTIDLWWLHRGKTAASSQGLIPADLFDFLCIEHLRLACPPGHFGAGCSPCPGFPAQVCSGRGACLGEGTREGTGSCKCAEGFGGELCATCSADGYYRVVTPEDSLGAAANGTGAALQCAACNEACSECTGPTDADCTLCSAGHFKAANGTCLDLNECDEESHGCPVGTYCRNTRGSRACTVCDFVCDMSQGCSGGGPEGCAACRQGYRRVEGKGCVVINNCHDNHDCGAGEYCVHEGPAEHSCQLCHASCRGCVDGGAKNCTSCAAGYIRIDNGPADSATMHCFDKNECNDFPCKFPEVCSNTEGSYTCKCAKNFRRDASSGVCTRMSEEEVRAEQKQREAEQQQQQQGKDQKKVKGRKGADGRHDEL